MKSKDVIINSALNPNNGRVYFFVKDKVIAFEESTDQVAPGYPVKISTEWQGLFPNAADAACLYPNGYVYFFKGDMYIRSTVKTKKVSGGYPKRIDAGWKDLWTVNIDASIAIGDYVYFFKDDQCLKYGATRKVPMHGFEGPKPIEHYFPGVWSDGIDAVVNWHDKLRPELNDKLYFFKGFDYIRFDLKNGKVDPNYPRKINEGWFGLQEAIMASSNELRRREDSLILPEITNVTVNLRWFKDVDIDLAAIYILKNGQKGIVDFSSKGDLNTFPYINLNKDVIYGDDNEEIIRIKQLDLFKEIHIICWDFSNSGGTGIFDAADVNVTIIDNNLNSVSVFLENESGKDAACIARIFSENGHYKVENKSKYFEHKFSWDPDELLLKING